MLSKSMSHSSSPNGSLPESRPKLLLLERGFGALLVLFLRVDLFIFPDDDPFETVSEPDEDALLIEVVDAFAVVGSVDVRDSLLADLLVEVDDELGLLGLDPLALSPDGILLDVFSLSETDLLSGRLSSGLSKN